MVFKLKKFILPLSGLLIFFLTLAGLFYLYESFAPVKQQKFTWNNKVIKWGNFKKFPQLKGLNHPPGQIVDASGMLNDKEIYKVRYSFNEFGMRDIPRKNSNKSAQHLMIGGGSYAFGQGLPVEQTFAYLLEAELPNYNVYNLSLMGGGVNNVLWFFRQLDMREVVKEDKGIFLYFFIGNHLSRWFGSPDFLSWANEYHPMFSIKDGRAEYIGLLGDQDYFKEYQRLKKLGLELTARNLSGLNRPNQGEWTSKEMSDFALGVNELKSKYLGKFPKGRFVFVMFPGATARDETKLLQAEIEKLNIEFVDNSLEYETFKAANKLTQKDLTIPYDGHPNARMHKLLKEYLIRDVFSKKADQKN